MNEKKLRESFLNPEKKYRAKPFWAWNGRLEKEELFRQIHIMKTMGFGGFFMHSRTGLRTEYLGEEWFKLINACADEGEKLGMEAWLYDEDRYPSGIAGGMVTERTEYKARFIELQIARPGEKIKNQGELVAVFTCRIKDNELFCFNKLELNTIDALAAYMSAQEEQIEDEESIYKKAVLVFSIVGSESKDVYNGYSYLDTMNQDAVEKFLELTHEKYKEKCGGRLGKNIVGIFTDEPHRGAMFSTFSEGNKNRIPYTERLFSEFNEHFGYDLREKLPLLFLRKSGAAFSKVSLDYVEICQILFLENYAKPIRKWCDENGMLFTGHVLHEDSLSAQTIMQGSLMRFYEYMDYPGVDILTEGNTCWWVVKQLDSVARQLNKPFELSEMYGGTGWQMSLEAYKQVGDWQLLFGINLRCPHLLWYTMQGEAKRDYPASIFYQSAWFEEYEKIETYFARGAMFMTQGKAECELLVLNPIESVWGYSRSGAFSGLDAVDERILFLEERYRDTFEMLVRNHIDFDYGEESIISRYGTVKEGTFWVGQCEYQKVLVTGLDTIRSSTLSLLKEFKRQGGMVIFAGECPRYVDGEWSEETERFAKQCIVIDEKSAEISTFYRNEYGMKISGDNSADILCRVKKDNDVRYVMLLNSKLNVKRDNIQLDFGIDTEVELWDARTGKVSCVLQNSRKAGCMKVDFAPGEEKFYRIYKRRIKKHDDYEEFSYRLSEDNVFVLDMVTAELQGHVFTGEVLQADRKIREYLGLSERSGQMLQPWYIEKNARKLDSKSWVMSLKFTFEVKKKPDQAIRFAFEDIKHVLDIELNGNKISVNTEKKWIDPCFSSVLIQEDLIYEGNNELTILYEYKAVNGLEAVYLLGEFGVYRNMDRNVWEMYELPPKLLVGDITYQGLPFYSGKIEYILPELKGRCKIQNLGFAGSCIKLKGKEEHVLFAPPYQCEVDDLNTVEVILTRRNTFGPLHCSEKRMSAYGPEVFSTKAELWTDEYVLLKQGLLESPEIELFY